MRGSGRFAVGKSGRGLHGVEDAAQVVACRNPYVLSAAFLAIKPQ